jgi:MFS transporter, MHS family, proline/betaine transporter
MRKVLISSMIGNALEWYDFVLFIQFSKIISQLFFPQGDPNVALLQTFGIFAVGFIMRPVGGILFGYIGDKYGRKSAIVWSILLMAVPTALIGIVPSYEQVGMLAPIILTVIRLMQGIALGGGFSGTMAFLVEHSPQERRGLIGSASMFSLGIGVLVGILVSTTFSTLMDHEAFCSWGWRLPFIASLAIGMVAFYIKANVEESPVFEAAKKHGNLSKAPIREVLREHMKPLFTAIAVYLTVTVPFYTFTAFFSPFLQNTLGYTLNEVLIINGVAIFISMIFVPIGGHLSDKYGRKPVLQMAALVIAIIAYPTFILLQMGGYIYPLIAQSIFGVAVGLYIGPVPAMLVEIFPTSVRFTGLALSYNISAAMFGGTVPFVYMHLINYTGSNYAPVLYILFFVVITLITIHDYRDKHKMILAE